MIARTLLSCSMFCLCIGAAYADEVIWRGKVNADGTPTTSIPLELHERYQIKVSESINLGKWNQDGEKLANDAFYMFDKSKSVEKIESLKNSQDVPFDQGTYHPDHVYQSEPFVAKQNRIHFWVSDTNYDDNNGNFHVEITHKEN